MTTAGPNAGCPDPVLPLTNVQSTVDAKIQNLTYWYNGWNDHLRGLHVGLAVAVADHQLLGSRDAARRLQQRPPPR